MDKQDRFYSTVEWREARDGFYKFVIDYPNGPQPSDTTIWVDREAMEKLYHSLGRFLSMFWDVDDNIQKDLSERHSGRHPILGTKK